MDFLYINAIVKETYLDLPCQMPFPEAYKSGLLKHAVNDAWLSAEGVNGVITYFTLKEKDKEPLFVLSKAARHTNCASVGRYIQSFGWQWTPGLAEDGLSKILRAGFYSEAAINDYALNGTVIPCPTGETAVAVSVPDLASDVKFTILTAVMRRWFRNEPALRIAVPEGVDYHEYVLAAVQRIYSCFPMALRVEAGFCSYLPAVREASPRVHIGFIPESMADSDTLYLDGSSLTVIKKYASGTTRKALDSVIRHLSRLDGDALADFVTELYEDVEGGGDGVKLAQTAAKDYFSIGEALDLLALQGGMDVLVPAWKRYYEKPDKYSKRMQETIQAHIRSTIEGQTDAFCEYFRTDCRGRSVTEVLAGYNIFCKDAPVLSNALWATALELLQEQKMTCQKIYGYASNQQAALSNILSGAKLDEVFRGAIGEQLAIVRAMPAGNRDEIAAAKGEAMKVRKNVTDANRAGVQDELLQDIDGYLRVLTDKDEAIVLSELETLFEPLKNDPAKTIPELMQLIEKVDRFRKKLEELKEIKGLRELKARVDAFKTEKEHQMNASGTVFNAVMKKLSDAGSYFSMLEALERDEDYPKLTEDKQRKDIADFILSRRPADTAAYLTAFKSHYTVPLTLWALSEKPAFVCREIIRDIVDFGKLTIPYNGEAPEIMADVLDDAEHVAGKISPTYTVEVLFDGKLRNPRWFIGLLKLSHTSAENKAELLEDLCALIELGVYSGSDMIRVLNMLSRCGMPCQRVFELMLQGKFRSSTGEQYRTAYETIYEEFGTKLPKLKAAADGTENKDDTAYKVFEQFYGEATATKKKKRGILIGGIVGGLVVIGVIAVLLLVKMGVIPMGGEADPTATPTPTPTVTVTPTPTPTPTPEADLTDDGTATTDDGTATTDDGTATTDDGTATTDDGTATTDGDTVTTDDGTVTTDDTANGTAAQA